MTSEDVNYRLRSTVTLDYVHPEWLTDLIELTDYTTLEGTTIEGEWNPPTG